MNEPTGNEYGDVLKVLDNYYRALLARLADEIREKQDDFDVPLLGSAEDLLEKYARAIYHLQSTYAPLKAQGEALFRQTLVWLKEDQFLCFSCRAVMRKGDLACPECGWSWRKEGSGRWTPSSQKLTERAQQVVNLAREQARRLRQPRVEPEHVLLALAQEGQGTAARALADLGITYEVLDGRVDKPAGPPPDRPRNVLVALGGATEQVLADAWAECRELEHGYVSTGHVLLALSRLMGEPAARVAALLQVDPAVLRRQVLMLLELDAAQ